MQMTAIKALELGWSVIPVKLNKRPYTSWQQYQRARPDKNMIAAWQSEHNPPAWAVVTGEISGLFVLDFDGEAGAATLQKLGLQPHVRTGSGGHHVYVEHPGFAVKTLNGKSKQELGRRYPGLDVRGDGGYAVYCGRNESGPYEWLRETTPYAVADLPEDLRRYLGLQAPQGDLISGDADCDVEGIVARAVKLADHGRNDAGFWLACQLRDSRLPKERAVGAMRRYQAAVGATNARGEIEAYTVGEALASLEQAYSSNAREPLRQIRVVQGGTGPDPDECSPLPTSTRVWPEPLAPEAFHGLAGEFVNIVGPHTEADPAALLLSFLAGFGNIIGRSAHFVAEADRHYMNLFVAQVGTTSKGRKGSSLGQVRRVFREIDATWDAGRIQQGLCSGEGLIWAARDPIEKHDPIREKGRVVGYQDIVIDPGVEDKRLLVVEGEFASTLRVMGRDGNTLSAVIRNAWDSGDLRVLAKNSPAKATGAHISIIGHITRDELLRYLDNTEAGNGFGNRFLWICVRRSKMLPEGGCLSDEDLEQTAGRIRDAVSFAKDTSEIVRDECARRLWHEVYPDLSEGKPGLLGAMIARAEAQVMRLACIYALLDCSSVVREEHLRAALAVWRYAEDSARFIFGDSLGDPTADELLRMLRAAPEGLTRTRISNLFGRNKPASEIGRALGTLLEHDLVRSERATSEEGRPVQLWHLTQPLPASIPGYESNEINEGTSGTRAESSSNSSISCASHSEPNETEWGEI